MGNSQVLIFGSTDAEGGPRLPMRITATRELLIAKRYPDYISQLQFETGYRALNPTPGTGIAMGIQTAYSSTANVLLAHVTSTTKFSWPYYLRLICTAAGASTTASDLVIEADDSPRSVAGGTALTKANAHRNSGVVTDATITCGAITLGAPDASRLVTRIRLKTQAAPCWVVGDQVLLTFGWYGPQGLGLTSGTVASAYSFETGPVVLAPSHTLSFHMWNTANAVTPPSWEVEYGWHEFTP